MNVIQILYPIIDNFWSFLVLYWFKHAISQNLTPLPIHGDDLSLSLYLFLSLSLSLSNGATIQGGPRPPSRISSIPPGLGRLLSSFYIPSLPQPPPLHLPNAAWVSLWGAFLLARWGGLSWINHRHPGVWHVLPISVYYFLYNTHTHTYIYIYIYIYIFAILVCMTMHNLIRWTIEPTDATIIRCIFLELSQSQHVSGIIMPIIRRTRTRLVKTSREDAWLCWLWLCGATAPHNHASPVLTFCILPF
jgi:hypothetical protein